MLLLYIYELHDLLTTKELDMIRASIVQRIYILSLVIYALHVQVQYDHPVTWDAGTRPRAVV